MIIEKLSLKNWRSYREPHIFSFDKGFNLVVGRNEAGKSTLFEALVRVLFDRCSSKAEDIRRIQPLNSSLGPETELIFINNGHRYKINKRFLHLPYSKLYTERDGQWDLDHEGDKADIELIKILEGNSPSRAAQSEHRGLAQALWYLQKEDPLPKKVWSEGVKQNLAGIIEFIVKSPEEDKICIAVEARYNVYYTPSGKIKSGCEITTLNEEINQKEKERDSLFSKASDVEKFRLELEDFFERKKEKQDSLLNAQEELARLKEQLTTADEVDEQKSVKESDIKQVDLELKNLESDLKTIDRRIKTISELFHDLSDANKLSNECEANSKIEQIAEEKYHRKWKIELEPKLKEIEEESHLYHTIEKIAQLTKEKEIGEDYLSKISHQNEEYQLKKKELAELIAPKKQEWDEFEDCWNNLQISNAEARASAIRIKFDLRIKDKEITANPSALSTDDKQEYLVLTPTTFNINKVGNVHIRGGGSTLEEINDRSNALETNIQNTFLRYNVKDKQSLSDLYQNRINLDREVKQLKKNLEKLIEDGKSRNFEEEIARLDREITEESQSIDSTQDSMIKISNKDLREKNIQLEKNKTRLIEDIEKEQENERNAKENNKKLYQEAIEARSKSERFNSQINSLFNENSELLKNYGTREQLVSLIDRNKGDISTLKSDLSTILLDYEKCVELPRKIYKEVECRILALEEQIRTLNDATIYRQARIEESAAQGLSSQISDLEVLLEINNHRLLSVQLEADSIKLLHDMIIALRKDQSTVLAGPVSELINKYLGILTDDAYSSLELNEELLPITIQNKRYGSALPLESLSYGTYEQIVILLRLALGVILSKNERNLVVIDDRLVNADPMRMKRFCLILQEVSKNNCQIIVATCNDTPYLGIKGRVITVPSDGKTT